LNVQVVGNGSMGNLIVQVATWVVSIAVRAGWGKCPLMSASAAWGYPNRAIRKRGRYTLAGGTRPESDQESGSHAGRQGQQRHRVSSWPPTTPSSSVSSRFWSARPPNAATTSWWSPSTATSSRRSGSWSPCAGWTASSSPAPRVDDPRSGSWPRRPSRPPCSAAPCPVCQCQPPRSRHPAILPPRAAPRDQRHPLV
jgi:hypothetical protein